MLALTSHTVAAMTTLKLEGIATVVKNTFPDSLDKLHEGDRYNFSLIYYVEGNIPSKDWYIAYGGSHEDDYFDRFFDEQTIKRGILYSLSEYFHSDWYDDDNSYGFESAHIDIKSGKVFLSRYSEFEGSEGCLYGEDEDHPCYGNYQYSFLATGRITDVYVDGERLGDMNRVIHAVPEPASWALMIAGFGLVGGVLRRTQRRQNPSHKLA